jgi:hypothetical protein
VWFALEVAVVQDTASIVAPTVGCPNAEGVLKPGRRYEIQDRSVTRIDRAGRRDQPANKAQRRCAAQPHGRSVLRVGGIARRACARAKRNQPGLRLARAPEGRVRGVGKLNQR